MAALMNVSGYSFDDGRPGIEGHVAVELEIVPMPHRPFPMDEDDQ